MINKTSKVNILQDFLFHTYFHKGFNLNLEQKVIIKYLQI